MGIVSHCALWQGMLEPTGIMENNPRQSSTLAFPVVQAHVQLFPLCSSSATDVLGVMQGHPPDPSWMEPSTVTPAEMETPALGLLF